jgi:peptide/nickel transport system permease protein
LSGAVGVAILAALAGLAIWGPVAWPVDPQAQDLSNRLAPPLGWGGTATHPLGTDALGRDMLARVIAGARVSLPLAAVATLAAATIGVMLGLAAGFGGKLIDGFVTWLSDVQLAIPFVVFAIAITAALGSSLVNLLTTLIITGWVVYARVVRLQARALRRAAWVEAARAIGASEGRVIGRHLLPNLMAPIAVLVTQQAGAMILYESSLTFLGLGASGNTVTWGGMAALGREALFKAPWVTTIPGAVIAVAILGCNLVGDWLAVRGREPVSIIS